MSDILLIRHGATDLAGTFCGHSDPPLNERGRQQVAALLEELTSEPIEAVYASDLQRAQETAAALSAAKAVPLHILPGLREIHFGEWEGLTWSEVETRDSQHAERWLREYPSLAAPGGEAVADFEARVLETMQTLLRSEQRPIAIVTPCGRDADGHAPTRRVYRRPVLRPNQGLLFGRAPLKSACERYDYRSVRDGLTRWSAMKQTVTIRELIAWDLDVYPWRDQICDAAMLEQRTAEATEHILSDKPNHSDLDAAALLAAETRKHEALLQPQRLRPELHAEMRGLDWSLGVVDLRRLIAFQRRLILDPKMPPPRVPQQEDWAALCSLAFDGRRSLAHRVLPTASFADGYEIQLHAENPDLRVTLAQQVAGDSLPLTLTGGSPFFEVAEFRGRWFLRDGYHRAYRMLRAGVTMGFAVIVHARTLEELGAVEPFFFGEETLFSARPPRVTDFLEERLVLTYERPRMRKRITVRIEESLEPVTDGVTEEFELQI